LGSIDLDEMMAEVEVVIPIMLNDVEMGMRMGEENE
jgi:hypothetical protein